MTRGNKEQRIHYKLDADTQINREEMNTYNLPFAGNNNTCKEVFIKGERVLEYSITGDITLEKIIEKPIFRDELVEYFYSISKQMVSMVHNGLELEKIIYDLKYMYVKLSDFSVQLVYLPVNGFFSVINVKDFLKNFLSEMVYAHTPAIECANQIAEFLDSHKEFNAIQFNLFIRELKTDSHILVNEQRVSPIKKEETAINAKTESEILYAEEAARNADIACMQTESEVKRLIEYSKQQAQAAQKASEMKTIAEAAHIQAEISRQEAEKEYKKYTQTAILYAKQIEEQQDLDTRKKLDAARIEAEKAAKAADEVRHSAQLEAEKFAREVRDARNEEMQAEEARIMAEFEARRNKEEVKRQALIAKRKSDEAKRLSEKRQQNLMTDIETVEFADEGTENISFPFLIRKSTNEKILINKQVFCIGKADQGVDYKISDNKSVSRRHAYITNINGACYLRDNNSTNHTYLNDNIVSGNVEVFIPDNSKIVISNEEFRFKNL